MSRRRHVAAGAAAAAALLLAAIAHAGALTSGSDSLRTAVAHQTERRVARAGLGPVTGEIYASAHATTIGGYGELLVQRPDARREDGAPTAQPDGIDVMRQVVVLGHRFGRTLILNSALALEHVGAQDAPPTTLDFETTEPARAGAVAFDFAYLEWAPRPALGARAGLLLVPLGLRNEHNEPTVTIGARPPGVERFVIPTVWSGSGAGLAGAGGPGLTWRAYVMEGLDAAGFTSEGAIRGGRQTPADQRFEHPAFTGRLDWRGLSWLMLGGSGFAGDAWQRPQPGGATLRSQVTVYDVHGTIDWRGFAARGLYAEGRLDQAQQLSDVLGQAGVERLGEHFFGSYVEGDVDVLGLLRPGAGWQLKPAARFEEYDTQDGVITGIDDPTHHHTVVTAGLAVAPHPDLILKVDREWRHSEARNETRQWDLAFGYQF